MDAAMGMGLTMDNVAIFWMRILSIVFVFGIIAVWCVWPYLPRKTTMRHTLHTILASVALVAVFGIVLPVQAQDSDLKAAKPTAISTAIERKEVMRDLWVEHIFWIRNVVIETLANNTAAAKVADGEVLANAKRVSVVIEPFCGKAGSDKFYGLIVGHYEPIKQYLEATVAGSSAKQDAALKDAVANGNELAVFLSGATGLPVDAARGMLLAHVGHHVQQINELHDHQYGAEAQTWTEMRQHMYMIADGSADAIEKKFPAKYDTSSTPRCGVTP
jgi:hypothetical protein